MSQLEDLERQFTSIKQNPCTFGRPGPDGQAIPGELHDILKEAAAIGGPDLNDLRRVCVAHAL
jgi:hypothetical protein